MPAERLARLEERAKAHEQILVEKAAYLATLINEKFEGFNERYAARIAVLEASCAGMSERLKALEDTRLRHEGGWWVVTKIVAVGAALGALILMCAEWFMMAMQRMP